MGDFDWLDQYYSDDTDYSWLDEYDVDYPQWKREQPWQSAALPAGDVREIEDVSGLDLAIASFGDKFKTPVLGIGERMGLVDEGTTQQRVADYQETLQDYIAKDPTLFRTMTGGLLAELGPDALVGAGMGKLATTGAKKLATTGLGKSVAASSAGQKFASLTPQAQKALVGSTAGAAEGAAMGFGQSAGASTEDTLLQTGLGALIPGAFGALGGVAARNVDIDAPNPRAEVEAELKPEVASVVQAGRQSRRLSDISDDLIADAHSKPASHWQEEIVKAASEGNTERLEYAATALRAKADTDSLTGLANRSVFDEEVANATAVGFADLDNFKGVNDTYGHEAGDTLLGEFAGIAKEMLRGTNKRVSIQRYGGDEFTVTSQDMTPEEMGDFLIDLRDKYANAILEWTDPDTGNRQEIKGFGFSIGTGKNKSLADADLYTDKKQRELNKLRAPGSKERAALPPSLIRTDLGTDPEWRPRDGALSGEGAGVLRSEPEVPPGLATPEGQQLLFDTPIQVGEVQRTKKLSEPDLVDTSLGQARIVRKNGPGNKGQFELEIDGTKLGAGDWVKLSDEPFKNRPAAHSALREMAESGDLAKKVAQAQQASTQPRVPSTPVGQRLNNSVAQAAGMAPPRPPAPPTPPRAGGGNAPPPGGNVPPSTADQAKARLFAKEKTGPAMFSPEWRKEVYGKIVDGIESMHTWFAHDRQPLINAAKRMGTKEDVRELHFGLQKLSARSSLADSPLVYGPTIMDGNGIQNPILNSKSMVEIIGDLDEEQVSDMSLLLMQRRARELADDPDLRERTSSRNKNGTQRKSGKPRVFEVEVDPDLLRVADDGVNDMKTRYTPAEWADMERRADELVKFAHDSYLLPLKNAGAISDADYARMMAKAGDYHVPLGKSQDESVFKFLQENSSSPMPKNLHKALEEGRMIDPQLVMQARAQAAKKFEIMEHVRKRFARIVDENPKQATELGIRKMTPQELAILREKGRSPKLGETAFAIHVNGEKIWYSAPKKIADLMENMTPAVTKQAFDFLSKGGPVTKFAQGATRLLRSGATLGPNFQIRNPLRDQWNALVYSKYGYNPLDLYRGIKESFFPTDFSRLMEQQGAGSSSLIPASKSDLQGMTTQLLAQDMGITFAKKVEKTQQRWSKYAKAGRVDKILAEAAGAPIKGALRSMEYLSTGLEQATRKGVAMRALKKSGGDINEAVDAFRDTTLDFKRAGAIGRVVNTVEAFFNAEMIDQEKFVRAMRENPTETSLKIAAYVGVPTATHWALHNTDTFGEPDPTYHDLPAWERAVFFHPGKVGGHWVRIPRPLGALGMISYMTEKGLSEARDAGGFSNEDVRRYMEPTAMEVATKNTPLHYLFNEEGHFSPLDMVPTAAEPMVELATNYDNFRGQSVVPSYMEKSLERVDHMDNNTTELARLVGRTIPEKLGVSTPFSPMQVDHLMEGHLSTVGRMGNAALDPVLRKARGGEVRRDVAQDFWGESPYFGTALASRDPIGFQSAPVQRLKQVLERAQQAEGSWKLALENGNEERANELLANTPELQYATTLRRANSQFSDMFKTINAIRDPTVTPGMTPEERREQIDAINRQMTEMARSLVEAIGANNE